MNKRISVVVPAYNEEKHIGNLIKRIKKNDIYEILVVNNASTDNTAEVAQKAGARVVLCENKGKGYAMEMGIKEAKGEILIFLDGDIENYHNEIIQLMSNPIIYRDVDFVKSTFDRNGGRVTLLLAKPLLSLTFPELKEYNQPLSGIIAGKKSAFEKVELEKDYGVDVGLLLDMFLNNFKMEQAYIGFIENDSQPINNLEKMSEEVAKAILKRAQKYNRLENIDKI